MLDLLLYKAFGKNTWFMCRRAQAKQDTCVLCPFEVVKSQYLDTPCQTLEEGAWRTVVLKDSSSLPRYWRHYAINQRLRIALNSSLLLHSKVAKSSVAWFSYMNLKSDFDYKHGSEEVRTKSHRFDSLFNGVS